MVLNGNSYFEGHKRAFKYLIDDLDALSTEKLFKNQELNLVWWSSKNVTVFRPC